MQYLRTNFFHVIFYLICNLRSYLRIYKSPADCIQQFVSMFCCRSASKKGKYNIEAFNKVKADDKETFALKSSKFEVDPELIKRIFSNKRVAEYPEPSSLNQFEGLVKGPLQDYIKKKVLKSDYQDLIKKYTNTNQQWTDPSFPPNSKSFGHSKQEVIWKRASQIIKSPIFVSDNFTPSDILQGRLGNCYFLSAVAGLAEKSYRIKKLFPNQAINRNGIYMARILHKGVYQQVVVDDYFPCTPHGELIGAQPAAGIEIWVMILQKCWAKIFGSYTAIDGGLPNQVLHSFSAAPTYNYRVSNEKSQLEDLWQKMLIADQKDQIICCGTQISTKCTDLKQLGLVDGHAYTILGVYQQPYRILKIRNPWGSMEWKGSASDNDKNFWSKIPSQQQIRLGYNNGEDGVFFMLFDDFERYFVIVDICEISDNANYFYIENNFSNGLPQCFDCDTQGGDLTITMTQTSKRQLKAKGQKSDVKYAHITLILARCLNNNQFEYVSSKADEYDSDLYLYAPDLAKGKYIVCCIVEGKSNFIETTVSIYSESNFYIIQSSLSNQDFLHSCFLSHAQKNEQGKQTISQNPLQWVCFDLLVDTCGIGYSAFHLDPKSTRKLGLQFNESEYSANGLELLPPFKGQKNIKLVCNPGQEIILLCKLSRGTQLAQFALPTPKILRLT